MNRSTRIAAAAFFVMPLVVAAQTTVPADQPRTDLEKQKTQQQGAATKYGEPGSASGSSQTTRKDATTKDSTSKSTPSKTSKDGQPNDPASTPTPMNTVSPTTTK